MRAQRKIRPEPLSLGGLIREVGRSRTWNPSRLAVEPSLPARVEKGAWRGARLPAVPAGGLPPRGCRLLATPGTRTRAGDLGSRPERRRCRHPRRARGRLGETVGQTPEAWYPRLSHAVCAASPAGLCSPPSHPLPPPPSTLPRLTWRRDAGRRGWGIRGGCGACSGARSRAAATAAALSAAARPCIRLLNREAPPTDPAHRRFRFLFLASLLGHFWSSAALGFA